MKLEQREVDIQRHILEYLKYVPGLVAGKTKTQGTFDAKKGFRRIDPLVFRGFPDICFFYKNRIGFIEVKSKIGIQSLEQKQFEQYCISAGITYILARSVEDVEKIINLI